MTDTDDITIRQKRMDDAKLQESGPPWRMWPDLAVGTIEKALREGRVKVDMTTGRTRAITIKSKLKRRLTPR
jgi:hypothetical protein